MNGIRLILFDAVGTLIYPEPAVADVYLSLATQFGSKLTRETIAARFHEVQPQRGPLETDDARERLRWRAIVQQVLADVPDIDPLFEQLWQHFARGSSWRLFDDVIATWTELLAKNIPLGIASNFDLRLHGVIRALNIAGISHVFSSAEVGYSKPDVRFFREVEQRTRLESQEILLVGDDELADVSGATAAGWQCVLLDRANQFKNYSCRTIASFAELLTLLSAPH